MVNTQVAQNINFISLTVLFLVIAYISQYQMFLQKSPVVYALQKSGVHREKGHEVSPSLKV